MRDAAMMLQPGDWSAPAPGHIDIRSLGGQRRGQRRMGRPAIPPGTPQAGSRQQMRHWIHLGPIVASFYRHRLGYDELMSAAASHSSGPTSIQPALRIAFFGGSFDPPHCGHLGIARAARQALALDTVLFAPVGRQPLKTDQPQPTDFAHRVAMTRLAIAEEPGFQLSLLDAPNADGEPNYTASTLERLRAELPHTTELFLLLGSDSLAQFARWHRAAEIPFLATLVVAARPGESRSTLKEMTDWLPASPGSGGAGERQDASALRSLEIASPAGDKARIYFLDKLDYPVSATQLRARLATDATAGFDGLLPPGVLAYIRAHRLYAASSGDRITM